MQRFALATCDECIDISKYTGTQVYGNDLDWLQVLNKVRKYVGLAGIIVTTDLGTLNFYGGTTACF